MLVTVRVKLHSAKKASRGCDVSVLIFLDLFHAIMASKGCHVSAFPCHRGILRIYCYYLYFPLSVLYYEGTLRIVAIFPLTSGHTIGQCGQHDTATFTSPVLKVAR